MHVQNFWSSLISSNFKKKHVELFFTFIQASIGFNEYSPYLWFLISMRSTWKRSWNSEERMGYFALSVEAWWVASPYKYSNSCSNFFAKFLCGAIVCWLGSLKSLTPMVAYMQPSFEQASFDLNNFSNFCPLTMFDSSKCAQALLFHVWHLAFLRSLQHQWRE